MAADGRFLEMVSEDDRASETDMISRQVCMAMTRARGSVTLVGSEPFCRFFSDVPAAMIEDVSL